MGGGAILKKTVRIAFWVVVVAGLIGGIYVALRPQPVLVDVAPVVRGALQVEVTDDGITRIRERYVVSTPLSGRLLRITFDVGDSVVAGETVLARMQPTLPELLDPRALAQAEARVSAAERRLEAARAELAKAEVAVDFAEEELGRLRRAGSQGAVSRSAVEQAEFEYRARTEDARTAGFAVDVARYELQLQRAALLLTDPENGNIAPENDSEEDDRPRSAEADEAEMELAILAPITGRVLRIYQESTAVITAGSSLMEVGDPLDLEVVVDVLSRDAVRVDTGDAVILENWGGPYPLNGRVRRVEPSGFTKVSALGVEEQRVNVIVDLTDSIERRATLGDNFRVDARIVVLRAEDVLQVPTSALFREEDQWMVFRVVGERAVATPVSVGSNNGLHAEIVEGLSERDRVIVHPGESVADGVVIDPR